jgi:hypothetical protein
MNDEDDSEVNYSRRAMLEATLLLVGMVALCDLATPRGAATGARHSPTLRYFTVSEAVTIDALVAHDYSYR